MGPHTLTAVGLGSVPGLGTKSRQTTQCGHKKKRRNLTTFHRGLIEYETGSCGMAIFKIWFIPNVYKHRIYTEKTKSDGMTVGLMLH